MCIGKMIKHITRIAYKRSPEKGDKGERGASIRQLVWDEGIEFYSGADGEEYEDFAFYGGSVYKCLIHHIAGDETPYESVESGDGLWCLVPSFENFATKVLLLGNGKEGWVMDKGVIKHTSGKIQLTADGQISAGGNTFTVDKDGNMVAKSGTFGNLTIGSTKTQHPCLKGTVSYDEHEEHSIEISPEGFRLSASVDGEEVEAFDFMPYYYADMYDRNESFRLKMRPGTSMSIEGGMIAGLRPLICMSSANITQLGNQYITSRHPGMYVLSSTDAFLQTLQTEDYTVGDCFTIINRAADIVGVINETQPDIFNTIDGKSYKNGQTVKIMASVTRVFYMLWTEDGFILYK